jgi:hypothetical protein
MPSPKYFLFKRREDLKRIRNSLGGTESEKHEMRKKCNGCSERVQWSNMIYSLGIYSPDVMYFFPCATEPRTATDIPIAC